MFLILFCISLALAVVLGPQTTPWTWGPGLAVLGFAVAALGGRRNGAGGPARSWLALPGWLCIGWFAGRALLSPVPEYGISDALLVLAVFGAFRIGMRLRRTGGKREGWILAGYLVLMIVANAVAVAVQLRDPSYTPVFGGRPAGLPSGLLGHYNEFSNVMLASGFFLLSYSLWGRLRWWARLAMFGAFAACMVCIYLSRSRGGMVGAGAGACVFSMIALLEAKRRKSRWFAPGVLLLPVILVAACWYVISGVEGAQKARNSSDSASTVLSDGRLYALGLAGRTTADHPWAGGGAHSFHWESLQYWNPKDAFWRDTDMIYVHNEFAQAVTDYGLVGGILLVLSLACLFGKAVHDLMRDRHSMGDSQADAWLPGAVAGAVAILVQSNFAFVFHNLPSCLLLGFSLGVMAGRPLVVADGRQPDGAWAVGIMHGLIGMVLVVVGIQGSRALAAMWPAEYAKAQGLRGAPLVAAACLAEAARYWPHSELYGSQAQWLLCDAQADRAAHPSSWEDAGAALREARRLNPLSPVHAVNHANVLSYLGRDREALAAYDDAIRLQGGYESGVRAHYHKALHLRKMAYAELSSQNPRVALERLEDANAEFRKVGEQASWYHVSSFPEERLYALEATARLQNQLGMAADAEQTLAEAAALPNSGRACYFYAAQLYDKGQVLWHDRQPGKALGVFMRALEKFNASGGILPPGVTVEDRKKLGQSIDGSIRFLQGARIRPE